MKEILVGIVSSGLPSIGAVVVASLIDAYLIDLDVDHYILIGLAAAAGNFIGQFQRHPAQMVRDLKGLWKSLDPWSS